MAERYRANPNAYRQARDGFFRRQLAITALGEVAAKHPGVTPDVANHLVSTGEWRAARDVVRDVLLAGHELRPLAFDDPAVSDVLGEEDAAEWLASLGAIRRLWQRPSPEIASSL